jgi:DNA-binding protein HU-beta
MNKSQLIEQVAAAAEINNASAVRAVDAMLDIISSTLRRGETVTLSGFGTFTVSSRVARNGRNPRTGQPIVIPASRSPRFKAGKGLRDALN